MRRILGMVDTTLVPTIRVYRYIDASRAVTNTHAHLRSSLVTYNVASEALRIVDRFTRVGEERLVYEWTVDNPAAFTRSLSAEIPMVKTDEMMFEYACHEGNHDIVNILTMSRALESQEAERAANKK